MPDSENNAPGTASVTSNIVTLPDGTRHVFPNDATPEEMQKALGMGKPQANLGNLPAFARPLGLTPNVIDSLRPILSGLAGGGAAAATSAIPVAGPFLAPAADVAGYSGVDYLLKKLNPNTQAQQQAKGDEASDSIKDGLINAVGGRILNGLFKGAMAFRNSDLPEIYKFIPTTSQALEAFGHHNLATAAKFAEDFGATGAKAAALDKAGGAGFTQALAFANSLNGRMASTNINPVKLADKIRETLEDGLEPIPKPQNFKSWSQSFKEGPMNKPQLTPTQEALDILQGGQNPFSKLDATIRDPDRLGKVLSAGQSMGPSGLNVRRDLQAYQFMRMVNDAKSVDPGGAIRLDANKMADMFNDDKLKTSLNTLYGKQGLSDISDFIKNVATTQDTMHNYPVAKQLRFLGSGFSIAGSLLTGNLHAAGASALGTAAAYIPTAIMGKLLTTQIASKIVGKLAAGEALDLPASQAGRTLLSALQGYNIALIDGQGNKTWGTIEKQGNDYNFARMK